MARLLTTYRAGPAERTLAAQLEAARSAMLRRGVAADAAAQEVRSLELAIRAELRTLVMRGGDVA